MSFDYFSLQKSDVLLYSGYEPSDVDNVDVDDSRCTPLCNDSSNSRYLLQATGCICVCHTHTHTQNPIHADV